MLADLSKFLFVRYKARLDKMVQEGSTNSNGNQSHFTMTTNSETTAKNKRVRLSSANLANLKGVEKDKE